MIICSSKVKRYILTNVSIGMTPPAFHRGELGGGISRSVKTDDSLAVLVPYETERDIRTIEEQGQERESGQTQSE
jgi:hypothetical protein